MTALKHLTPRTKGINYKVVKGMMSHFSFFGGNDVTLLMYNV